MARLMPGGLHLIILIKFFGFIVREETLSKNDIVEKSVDSIRNINSMYIWDN